MYGLTACISAFPRTPLDQRDTAGLAGYAIFVVGECACRPPRSNSVIQAWRTRVNIPQGSKYAEIGEIGLRRATTVSRMLPANVMTTVVEKSLHIDRAVLRVRVSGRNPSSVIASNGQGSSAEPRICQARPQRYKKSAGSLSCAVGQTPLSNGGWSSHDVSFEYTRRLG